jgi:hypothetical protein
MIDGFAKVTRRAILQFLTPGRPARAFPDDVGTGSSQKMRQNKDLESFAIAARS